MSYSFEVKAATKFEAREAVSRELDKVVKAMPDHQRDRPAITAAADALIDLLEHDETTRDVGVRVSGSLGWRDSIEHTTSATMSVSAWSADRPAASEAGS